MWHNSSGIRMVITNEIQSVQSMIISCIWYRTICIINIISNDCCCCCGYWCWCWLHCCCYMYCCCWCCWLRWSWFWRWCSPWYNAADMNHIYVASVSHTSIVCHILIWSSAECHHHKAGVHHAMIDCLMQHSIAVMSSLDGSIDATHDELYDEVTYIRDGKMGDECA